MQKDNYTDFDLELKRMLHDAEEEVPSRVWDAVSGELDRRDRRKVVALRWRRAAVGMAAAAAVLSGIFVFTGRDRDRTTEPAITAEAAVQSFEVPQPETAVPSIEEQIAASSGAALADIPAQSARRAAPKGTVPASVVPPAAVPPAAEPVVTAPPAAEPAEAQVIEENPSETPVVETPVEEAVVAEAPAAVSADTRPAITGTFDDPFAWPEEDESKASVRDDLSFTLAGNAMTNDFNGTDIRSMRIPAAGIKARTGVEEKGSSTFSIPVTFGLGLRFNLSDRWAVGTGINWSRLSRTFNGVYTEVDNDIIRSVNSEITNDLHYIGVPLNLYYNIFDSRNLRFYAWGGGSAEKGIANKYRIQSDAGDIFYNESIDGLQWSAAAGLGLEFLFGNHFGLYFDPSARYYFDCGQPASIRTKRPFMMNYEVGVRFNL